MSPLPPKHKVARNGLDSDPIPPLLKTCVMCRTRKVKCGSEKPACINCIKYRCECVYLPSARHMRGKHPHQQPQKSHHHSTAAKFPQKYQENHDDLKHNIVAAGIAARAATVAQVPGSTILNGPLSNSLPSPSSPAKSASVMAKGPSTASIDGLSQSQLMKPVSHSLELELELELGGHPHPKSSSSANATTATAMSNRYASTAASIASNPSLPSLTAPSGSSHHTQIAATASIFSESLFRQIHSNAPPLPPISLASHPSHMQPLSSTSILVDTAPDTAPWRSLPPISVKSSSPVSHTHQLSYEYSLSSNPVASDVMHDASLPPTSGPTPSVDVHMRSDRTDRSGSFGGSSSGFGSPTVSYSPSHASSGVDPRAIEASLPSPVPDTLDNMLKAFFRYQYPSSGVVLEEFFWFRYHRNMLTPLIIYAMLAVAAWNIASDDGDTKYANIHETFYKMAKQHVEDAMDEAHLRSVQGLLVLANYEALVGRWGTMWNHTTMARRLAEGIIFRDTDFPWIDVQRDEFDFEFQRVQRAYWHSMINDIWASVLMDKEVGGIAIALPPRPTYDFTYRYIRMLPSESAPGYHVSLRPDVPKDPRWGNTAASSELYLLIGEINNVVFLFQHAGKSPAFEDFIDFEMRLTNWYLNLPENVRLDDETISRFTETPQRADLGEIISTHIFWNFARLLLMKMGLVLSLREDPDMLRNIYATKAFYTTDSRALQFYQSAMPILTPDKAASYDEWLFHFCRCMSLQSTQNVVNLLKLGERHNVHPGHFGAGLSLPLIQVISVSLGLVRSPDSQVVQIAVDHLTTVIRTLLRLKHWFNTAQLLLHLFLAMQDQQLVLPESSILHARQEEHDQELQQCFSAIELSCPFSRMHLITELMRRLRMTFEDFVKETIQAVRMSSPTKDRIDPCISPLLRHLPAQSQMAQMYSEAQEPDWFKYAPGYLRSAWKRLVRTYKPVPSRPEDPAIATGCG
ncbi:hypothetical protein IW140_006242 [Coemansia sp. RSA 1813]|nr:hypothetical protein EV178_006229 [Coemansia sp. RSA 1646]KAJ1765639.1 hypothetical protein LPJ74_006271 [Coemansia sp. RSA 1843]KAJ2085728.1 hypothetical protein IW138_006151 [Coemansia sp. RSA 986]KAJ2210496.1 hypothetical protein EV179_006201 [Coemansia sp. RSA 487]KAJ2563061.1 hypothetical protein IW140_006242 [Coemansia sp. RSA 1813]